jgi:abhydrolase domain-containing protein 12
MVCILSNHEAVTHVMCLFFISGDSTGTPTEEDVVKDAMYLFEYLNNVSPKTSIYVWGHSLGTGVSTKFNRLLNEKS